MRMNQAVLPGWLNHVVLLWCLVPVKAATRCTELRTPCLKCWPATQVDEVRSLLGEAADVAQEEHVDLMQVSSSCKPAPLNLTWPQASDNERLLAAVALVGLLLRPGPVFCQEQLMAARALWFRTSVLPLSANFPAALPTWSGSAGHAAAEPVAVGPVQRSQRGGGLAAGAAGDQAAGHRGRAEGGADARGHCGGPGPRHPS